MHLQITYSAELFNVEMDGDELNDVIRGNVNIAEEMEDLLRSTFDYEWIDCVAKHEDFRVFEQYWWSKNNESEIHSMMKHHYAGFDDNDWHKMVEWRQQFIESPFC